MVIKRQLFLLILFVSLYFNLSAQNKFDGIWVEKFSYDEIIKDGKMEHFAVSDDLYSWKNVKYIPNSFLSLDSRKNNFFSPELAGVKIQKIEKKNGKTVIYLDKFYEDVNYHWEIQLEINEIKDGVICFETDDEILNDNYSEFNSSVYWYRISSPPAIPLEYAELNDTRVRVRTEPNLSCDTWGYVNKNDLLIIKDKSSDKFEIDGEKWYWYKVESEYLPDGWVYGKYLNKISKEDYEKKLELKNNPPVTEQKLSKLEIIQSVSDVSSILKSEAKRKRDDKKNVVYSELKKMYRNYGTSYDGNKDILEITDNRYSYNHNLKIGMSKNEIVVLLGEPDEEQNNKIIYRDKFGRLWLYTLTLYIKKDSLEKIELKRENLQF